MGEAPRRLKGRGPGAAAAPFTAHSARLAASRPAGDAGRAQRFRDAHQRRVAALRAVLWNEDAGVWLDYNLARRRHNRAFYPSNLTPLWAQCGSEDVAAAERALRYLEVSLPGAALQAGLLARPPAAEASALATQPQRLASPQATRPFLRVAAP